MKKLLIYFATITLALNSVFACDSPTGLYANNFVGGTAILNWAPVNGAVVQGLGSYEVQYREAGLFKPWETFWSTTNSKKINVSGNKTYKFKVRAACAGNTWSNFSSEATFTTPFCGTPSGLNASNITSNSATVKWSPMTCVDHFQVKYRKFTATAWITVTSNTNLISLNGLSANTKYVFTVQPFENDGYPISAESQAAYFTTTGSTSGTCGMPTGLNAINITNSSATLKWTAVSSASSYEVAYKTSSTSAWTTIITTTNSKTINNLISNNQYTFKLKTVCSSTSSSNYSSESTFTTSSSNSGICDTPTGFYASNITNSSTTLNWTAVNGAVSYEVLYIKSPWYSGSISSATSTSNSISINGLIPNTDYLFKVRTNCANSFSSNYSSETTFTTTGTSSGTCGTPSGLNTSNITSNSATLKWSAVNGASSYEVQYKINSGTTWSTVTSVSNSKTINNLSSNKQYIFKVKTFCPGSSASSYSLSSTFSTADNSFGTCETPSGLYTSNITSGGATLKWTAVSGASSYEVQYKKTSGTTWTTVESIPNSKTITGLSANSSYIFKVKAKCSASSSSAYSSTSTFTTSGSASGNCGTPTGLYTSNITSSGATLKWAAVSGAISYEVQYKQTSGITWKTVTSTSNSKTITGLSANTNYIFKVKTKCSGSASSNYSLTKTFKTLSGGFKTSGEDETTEATSIETREEIQNSISEKNMEVNIYPNPAQSFVNIHFDRTTEKAGIKVFDLIGKIVISDVVSNINNGDYTLSVQNLHEGIYQVVIQTEKEAFVKKLIVQK